MAFGEAISDSEGQGQVDGRLSLTLKCNKSTRVQNLGFSLGLRVQGLEFRGQGLGFRVQDLGFRVGEGLGCSRFRQRS